MENGKIKLPCPGIERIKTKLIYRTLAIAPKERMGLGFMNKTRRVDFADYRHPEFVLVIVFRGHGQYLDKYGRSYEVSAGNCFKRFPDELHSNYVDPESRWLEYFIEIGPALYRASLAMNIIRPESPVVEKIRLDEKFLERLWWLKERLRTVDETELPIVSGEIFSILGECRNRIDSSQSSQAATALMDKACKFLSKNFDQPCDVKAFCQAHGIGYESFRKMFKRQNGVSPWRYRILRRLDAACVVLRNSESQIAEIASALGYSSQFEFSSQFKQRFGISPTNYRQ
ncbi:MAG: AraC family transcriptional regulator [Victivallales bacterium]|nr:AraC family transcriptional regulator [Victivallales bacterium]